MRFIPERPIAAPSREDDPQLRYPYLIDGGWLLVLLLSLFALRPLVVNAGLPNGPDVLYHTYRTAEMARSWQHGVLFPRWAEGMYYGYGSPVFHYYASFTYYIGAVLMLVFGLAALDALRWLIILSVLLAATSMYFYMRQQIGRTAAVLGALAYVYCPYFLYTEPYGRGAYPELFALALFPFVMLAYSRAARTQRGADILGAAFLHGLLILSHNLMAVAFTGMLAVWLMCQFFITARPPTPPVVADDSDDDEPLLTGSLPALTQPVLQRIPFAGLLAFLLAIGWTAYFWLPVMLETNAIQINNVTAVAELSYQNSFVPLEKLLAFAPIMDNGAINGLLHVLSLGVVQWVGALAGIATSLYALLRVIIRRRAAVTDAEKQRRHALYQGMFWALLALIMLWLITPQSASVWAGVRPLAYLQFPWRLLGPLAFCLAYLLGMNGLWLYRLGIHGRAAFVTVAIALLLVSAFPLLNVPEWLNKDVDVSIGGYLQAEIAKRQSGTTYTNEYRPVAVLNPPGYTPELVADYSDGYPVNKAHAPDDVQVTLIRNNPEYNEWRINAPDDFTMEIYNFDWLGWTAEVDGQTVPITPSREHGLITLPVPAGAHTVKVYLGTTPARTFGFALTAVALVAALGTLALLRAGSSAARPTDLLPLSPTLRQAIVIGGLITIGLAIPFWRAGTMWRETPPGESPAQYPVNFALGENQQFQLIGYDINATDFHAGDTLHLTLYWFPAKPGGAVNFSTFVHVALPATPPIAQADKLHPGGRAIAEWWQQPAGYILDEYEIRIPDGAAAGEYTLFVGFYTTELPAADGSSNGYRPPAFDAERQEIGDSIPLMMIQIEP